MSMRLTVNLSLFVNPLLEKRKIFLGKSNYKLKTCKLT